MAKSYRPTRLASELPVAARVSVLIGARNAERTIGEVIGAVARQTYSDGPIELFVAVAPSEDDTLGVVKSEMGRVPGGRLLLNEVGDVASGLNMGLAASHGDVVVILSAHSVPGDDYVECIVDELRRTRAGLVGGAARPVGVGVVGSAIAVAHRVRFGLGGAKFRDPHGEGWADTAYAGGYPKSVVDEVGMWNHQLVRNQDIEYNARVRSAGFGVYVSSRVVLWYHTRRTLGQMARQNYGNGYWNSSTTRSVPGTLSLRHYVPGVFVASLAILASGSLLGWVWPTVGIVSIHLLALVAGMYVVACCVATLRASMHEPLGSTVALPVVFAVLHVSYGWGTICGFVRTLTLRRDQVAK